MDKRCPVGVVGSGVRIKGDDLGAEVCVVAASCVAAKMFKGLEIFRVTSYASQVSMLDSFITTFWLVTHLLTVIILNTCSLQLHS